MTAPPGAPNGARQSLQRGDEGIRPNRCRIFVRPPCSPIRTWRYSSTVPSDGMAGLYARVISLVGNEIDAAGSILSDAAVRPRGMRNAMQAALVERAMRGDKEAFASLAAASADGCYALAYRILRDPHRAQDAAQRAMLGAWRDLPTLRDPSRFDAWLHRLVVNACYAELRAERRWVARVRLAPADSLPEPDIARAIAEG